MPIRISQGGSKAGIVNEVSPRDSDWGQYLLSNPELAKASEEEHCHNTLV